MMSLKIQNKTVFVLYVILAVVMLAPVFADQTNNNKHIGQAQADINTSELYRTVTEAGGRLGFELREQEVIPFSHEETIDVFRDTDFGGVHQVISKDKTNKEQIRLIQSHIQTEAKRFSSGDFGYPSYLHGESMPGLKDISAAATTGDLQIQYVELGNGAEIRYEAQDPWTIIALHLWFQAHVGDHGAHVASPL